MRVSVANCAILGLPARRAGPELKIELYGLLGGNDIRSQRQGGGRESVKSASDWDEQQMAALAHI